MQIGIISLFPEMFSALNYGIVGRAQQQKLLQLQYWNPRDFTHNKHQNVDDRPYGGGPGMVMMVQPLRETITAAKQALGEGAKVIFTSPQGKKLDHAGVMQLKNYSKMIMIAGRYEGVDQRFIDTYVDEEWSIGDYVLSGGELAAMVVVDAVIRQIPGVLGDAQSAEQDSFQNGLLDCPHYTRPEVIDGLAVPPVLLKGDHESIRRWRLKQSLGKTWLSRPDLLTKVMLDAEQQQLLNEFIEEYRERGIKQ